MFLLLLFSSLCPDPILSVPNVFLLVPRPHWPHSSNVHEDHQPVLLVDESHPSLVVEKNKHNRTSLPESINYLKKYVSKLFGK